MNKEFHLKDSKNFCMLPWTHIHILPSSSVTPCCVWPYNEPLGNVKNSSLKENWNNVQYTSLRKRMLADKPSKGCAQCYERESAGAYSLRQESNDRWSYLYDKLVAPSAEDGILREFKMAYFDIRFSNICNFKCRGCSPELSSAWKADFDAMYEINSEKSGIISILPNEKIWEELISILPTVEATYFAGGEPLIMDEHYLILEKLIELGRTNVPLSYNSNLSNLKFKTKYVTDYWKHFKHVFVGISIDDFGKRGEYFRHGMNWEKTLQNIKHIKETCPHVVFSVNCTISLFNVSYLPELHDELVKLNVISIGNFFANLLVDPIEYRVQLLPKDYKIKIQKKLTDYIALVSEKHGATDPFAVSRLKAAFNSVVAFMNDENEEYNLEKFKIRNDKLDEIRNENFLDIYPELHFLKK